MNRLQEELQRLYGPQADAPLSLELDVRDLVDAQGRVRAMVLELARPADWAAMSAVWGGVQTDLALPTPAIAVNGRDGCQLWFSLSEPVLVPKAAAFLDALRRRYLGDILPVRVGMLPALDAAPARPLLHVWPVPTLQTDSGLWSAFVASDLASMFAEEPWLDTPPNPDGQAQLLALLKSISPAEFELAVQQLKPTTGPAAPRLVSNAAAHAAASLDPKRFLLDVMNNTSLDLALRIEAAKALLPYFDATDDLRQDLYADRRP
ncbi:MAG: hypothetical protein ABI212_11045 [Burkholderiaceae bacterium]